MNLVPSKPRMLSWYIGAIVVAVATTIIGFVFVDEGAPELAQQAVLVTVPLLSLSLMYLTLRSES